ncbi:MAG: TIGR03752 family integrating conjugative element protein [Gammaproteobacteria bacterium]|nr:TIGR03752 family integrating conjugative element protein [Gammaproteobacteria bacterium]
MIPQLNRKALYVLGIAILGLLMLVLSAPWSSGPTSQGTILTDVPNTPAPDADSPADTIKTLTATMSSLVQEIDDLSQSNESLRTENQELRAKTDLIEVRITERLRAELLNHQVAQEELAEKLTNMMSRFDGVGNGQSVLDVESSFWGYEPLADLSESWHWVESMETQFGSGTIVNERPIDKPRYTIPQNATLVDSTTMTALIGRVPVENRITDPLPFKVVTGADNLAANGFTIAGLEGSIWSGFVVGDWALACVTGTLTSVTFVFDDGRIRTLGQNNHAGERIGWISDERGVPCISGERKTNVRSWLIAQLGVNVSRSAAEALANANTTVQQNPMGIKEAFISGEIKEFVMGKSIASTGNSLADWLTSRASQEFDAIFVPTDQKVAIHVDRPLHIDYEREGRRLIYAKEMEDNAPLDMD